MLDWDGFDTSAISRAYREVGVAEFTVLTGALQNMVPIDEEASGRGVMRDEALKASLAMRFLSQCLAASYHSKGLLSEGQPFVRHAT